MKDKRKELWKTTNVVSCEVTVFVFAPLHQGTVKTNARKEKKSRRCLSKRRLIEFTKKGRETKLSECEEISVKFLA